MWDDLLKYLKHPDWRKQHGWRRAIYDTVNRVGLTGMHALPINRRWVDIHRRKMPLEHLPPELAGLKIVQVSDLHYSPVVWQRYLLQYIRWVNDLNPDMVVVTGDLITGGYRYAHKIATILSHLHARLGVICTLGNHDYSMYGKSNLAEGERRADYLAKCLRDRGLIVLRNELFRIRPQSAVGGGGTSANGQMLQIVGLDDEWSGHLDADAAFAAVQPEQPTICLNHNPVNCNELMAYPWQWMLSGHTHGRQVATSKFGRKFYPNRYRHFTHGYYAVNGRHLYVNRGLSYGQRTHYWCRPEVTVFTLQAAGFSDGSNVGSAR